MADQQLKLQAYYWLPSIIQASKRGGSSTLVETPFADDRRQMKFGLWNNRMVLFFSRQWYATSVVFYRIFCPV
jgi:hypothetical protein